MEDMAFKDIESSLSRGMKEKTRCVGEEVRGL